MGLIWRRTLWIYQEFSCDKYLNYKKNIVITNVGGNLQQDVAEPIDIYEVIGSASSSGYDC